MANWKHKLDLKDLYSKVPDDITPQKFCEGVKERIEKLSCYHKDSDLQRIVWDFEWRSEDDSATWDDIDEIMSDLYDWGDTRLEPYGFPSNRMCWIATQF